MYVCFADNIKAFDRLHNEMAILDIRRGFYRSDGRLKIAFKMG